MDQTEADSGSGQRAVGKDGGDQLEKIISRSPVVVFRVENAEGWPVAYVSDNVHTIFGWSKHDFLEGPIPYAQVVHPGDLARVVREKACAGGSSEKIEHAPYRVIARDGTIRWVEEYSGVVRNADGCTIAYEGVLIDITHRRNMEEKRHLIEFSVGNASEGITWIDSDARIVYVNDEECRRLGYRREELMEMTVFDVDPTVTPLSWRQQWEELRRRGAITREAEHRSKNGEVFPIESSIKFIQYGNREYSFAFRRDITERKRIEEAQARLQAELLNAMELADLGPWEHDLVSDLFTLSDHFFRIHGVSARDVGGPVISSEEFLERFAHPDDRFLVKERMGRIIAGAAPHFNHQIEHRYLFPDGSVRYMAVRFFFVADATGKPVKAYGVNQDITDRKMAERERLSNLKYFESMDMVNRAMQGAQDIEQMMRDSLDAVLAIFKCDRAFLLHPCDPDAASWSVPMERTAPGVPVGVQPAEAFPVDADAVRVFRMVLDAGRVLSFGGASGRVLPEDIEKRLDGSSLLAMALHPKMGRPWLFGIHQCSHVRNWSPGEETLLQGIGRRLGDALSSMLMYRDLRKSEAFLNSIVENIPDMILVKDAGTFNVMRVNKAGEKLLGLSRQEIIGNTACEFFPGQDARQCTLSDRQAMEGGMLVDVPEEEIRRADGGKRVLHTQKIPLMGGDTPPRHLLVISQDITELKRLQAQLIQTQKMEALGTMSEGIAHDFNNILQPMLGYCELLRDELSEGGKQWQCIDAIYSSGQRARDLVNQILTFSRRSEHKRAPVMLQTVLREAVQLARSIIPTNIEIETRIGSGCGPVMSDPTQLHQIFMNLIINAWHAMEESGGKISVRLEERYLGEADVGDASLSPGRYSVASVADTGCGMSPAVMEKIFEPYFTTKPQGRGSGLGLAVAYGIVKEHGGHIAAVSGEGNGATFTVTLPLTEAAAESPLREAVEMSSARSEEHILLVDDEEVIIEMLTAVLERLGYRVTACGDGDEALELFRADPRAPNLVITDMNMPRMMGDQLAGELMKIRPDIPIIICSGYSDKIGDDEIKALGIKGVLKKPMKLAEMSRTVRRVLDSHEA